MSENKSNVDSQDAKSNDGTVATTEGTKNEEDGTEATDEKELTESLHTETRIESPSEEKTESENKAEETDSKPGSRASTSRGSTMSRRSGKGKKKKRSMETKEDVHNVTLTVTIAKAIPTMEEEGFRLEDMVKKKKRIVEAPKAQNYYHCSYYLLPDDTDATKTDVVTFGMAAKIYTDHESKVLKTWQEGDHTWVAWSHSHTVTVTKELLLKLFNHTLELRIWDSKEKVSPKARFDRPKAFRLPQAKSGEDPEDVGGVRSLVMKQSHSFISMQPKKSFISRPVPQNGPPEMQLNWKTDAKGRPMRELKESDHSLKTQKTTSDLSMKSHGYPSTQKLDSSTVIPEETAHTLVSVPVGSSSEQQMEKEDVLVRSYSRLGRLAGAPAPSEVKQLKKQIREQQQKQKEELKKKESGGKVTDIGSQGDLGKKESKKDSRNKESAAGGKRSDGGAASAPAVVGKKSHHRETPLQKEARRRAKKAEAAAAARAAYIKEHGNCCIPVQMKILFSGVKSVTNRLDKPVQGIEDVFITVSLDGPLMSEEQKQELNPLVIKVNYATNLPNTPINYDELDRKCLPVYCKYKFYKQPEHRSIGRSHTDTVYWEDTNVVLLGTLDEGEVREYLNGPPLEVEVHDRDRKDEEVKQDPTLFGEDQEDDKIGNVGMVTGKRTLHNPFRGRDQPWDPYGVAKLQLADLLLGERIVYMTVPIHSCPIPDLMGFQMARDGKLIGIPNSVDGPRDLPLPMGHYMESNSQLKVRVEVSYPLTTPRDIQQKAEIETPDECPFARIIYIFEYNNTKFLNQIQSLVTEINAKALSLDSMPKHVIEAALSTYKLSEEQQRSRNLDIVTGFQVMDGEMHIFVLEGLRDEAIKKIWQKLPRLPAGETRLFEALYNSDLMFSERQYATLDVDLTRVRLHEPLSIILKQPLLYVRDMVPKPCLDAIIKLDQLTQTKKLRDVARNDLFPTSEMILSLSREFGVPLTMADFEELKEVDTEVEVESKAVTVHYPHTSREWTPIDMYNEDYMLYLENKARTQKHNYVKENIGTVHERSKANKKERPKTIAVVPVNGQTHNYSTQYLNSTEQAREKLRQELSKEPDRRFTYCQDYNSATVVPINVEAVKKAEEAALKAAWRTEDGFVYPGVKDAMESNIHVKKPHPARVDELTETWRENILHSSILKPTLERDRAGWRDRYQDFNVWSRPTGYFAPRPPITIHLAGDTLASEQQVSTKADLDQWKSRIMVDNIHMKYHRCAPDTEQTYRGPMASNQLDKLQGLLKDEPKKISLRRGPELHEIPPLSVVLNPSVDTKARLNGVPPIQMDDESREKHHGFNPGPYDSLSWGLPQNRIPIRDMEHAKFAALKGHDFRLFHKDRHVLSRIPVKPLVAEEKDNHLFKIGPTEEYRYKEITSGNICYRQPQPSIRPAPVHTEFYYPDRDKYVEKPTCKKAAAELEAAQIA
ncbi:uncharacterized protein [Ptychodera flava]|uniref:uncharacterized protein n=1 Tax=Ptychodera flava TaxID=63121 RepID=UPI00396A1C24